MIPFHLEHDESISTATLSTKGVLLTRTFYPTVNVMDAALLSAPDKRNMHFSFTPWYIRFDISILKVFYSYVSVFHLISIKKGGGGNVFLMDSSLPSTLPLSYHG